MTWKNLSKKKNQKYLGCHLIAEFWQGRLIRNPKEIKKILTEATKASHNTPLEIKVHRFSPQGMTAVALLAESHIQKQNKNKGRFISVSIEKLFGNLSETQLPEMKSWVEYVHARYQWVREQ